MLKKIAWLIKQPLFIGRRVVEGKQLPTGTIIIFDEEQHEITDYCIYCRVSSHDQKEDLIRQENRLKDFCSAKGFKY